MVIKNFIRRALNNFPARLCLIACTPFCAVVLGTHPDGIYFADQMLNSVFLIAVVLAWIPLLFLLDLSSLKRKIVVMILSIFLGLFTLMILFFQGYNGSTIQKRFELKNSVIVANQIDEGAFGYGPLLIEQHLAVLPGLEFVHRLAIEEATGVDFAKQGENDLRCEFFAPSQNGYGSTKESYVRVLHPWRF